MKQISPIIQYLPLWIFLGISRYYGQTNLAWQTAFQIAGLAAIIAFALTLLILKNNFNRLIAGANLFLMFGGLAFFSMNKMLLDIMDQLRTSALTFFIGIMCALCTVLTPTGVFEINLPHKKEKQYSLFFLVGAVGAFTWSYWNKTDIILGGALPFIFLILLRHALKRQP